MFKHEMEAKEISELIRLYWLLDRDGRIQTFGYMRGLVDEAKMRGGIPLSRIYKESESDGAETPVL